MTTIKIFLASSSELAEDRQAFELFVHRLDKDWQARGVSLKPIVWEDFLDVMSQTRLQDEYNRAIQECDLFVMLFFTKVGKFTEEEFDKAFGQFQATGRPFILTYFKDAPIQTGAANKQDLMSLWAFQDKLKALGHYQTVYKNIDELKLHFSRQLDKLAAKGFAEFQPEATDGTGGDSFDAQLSGNGAIAQGTNAKAVGAGGVFVGGNNSGDINLGTQIATSGGAYIAGGVNTGGGDFTGRDRISHGTAAADLNALFSQLLATVVQLAPPEQRGVAAEHVEALKTEAAKGAQAEDGKLAKILDGLTGLVPSAVGAVVGAFATPILGGLAGPVTKYVLDKLQEK